MSCLGLNGSGNELKYIFFKYRHTLLKITQSILQLRITSLQIAFLWFGLVKESCEYLAYSRRYAHFSVSIF